MMNNGQVDLLPSRILVDDRNRCIARIWKFRLKLKQTTAMRVNSDKAIAFTRFRGGGGHFHVHSTIFFLIYLFYSVL